MTGCGRAGFQAREFLALAICSPTPCGSVDSMFLRKCRRIKNHSTHKGSGYRLFRPEGDLTVCNHDLSFGGRNLTRRGTSCRLILMTLRHSICRSRTWADEAQVGSHRQHRHGCCWTC